MRALEVFGFRHNLTGLSDHQVDASEGTSESMGSSRISRNIFIWVLLLDDPGQPAAWRPAQAAWQWRPAQAAQAAAWRPARLHGDQPAAWAMLQVACRAMLALKAV